LTLGVHSFSQSIVDDAINSGVRDFRPE